MNEKWVVPCNLKHFNVEEHFASNREVVWSNSFTMKTGDTAYIYVASPESAIRYRCKVIADTVDEQRLLENSYAIPKHESHNYFVRKNKYVILKLDRIYPKGFLSLTKLRAHGLGQVQMQARASKDLNQFLTEVDQYIDTKKGNGREKNA